MFKKAPIIGLDFSGKSLNVVQLQTKGGKHTLLGVASAAKRDAGEGLSDADAMRVMDLLRSRGIAGARIVSAVPLDMQLLGSYEIPPPDSGAPIDDITRSELARESKLGEDAIESDWWVLPSTGRSSDATRAITVGVSSSEASALAIRLEERGFEPLALDVRGVAILRACAKLLDTGKISTFVEIGEVSTLICVCLDGTIVYYRRVEEGLESIINEVMKVFNVDSSVAETLLLSCREKKLDAPTQVHDLRTIMTGRLKQIVEAVRAAISYASHRYPRAEIGNVLLLGAGVDVLDVVPVFDDQVGLPTRRIALGDVLGENTHPMHAKSALVPAAGLAMYSEAA